MVSYNHKKKRKEDKKMKRINELKERIRNAEEMMKKYPEDTNLMEAAKLRIEISLKEIEELKTH